METAALDYPENHSAICDSPTTLTPVRTGDGVMQRDLPFATTWMQVHLETGRHFFTQTSRWRWPWMNRLAKRDGIPAQSVRTPHVNETCTSTRTLDRVGGDQRKLRDIRTPAAKRTSNSQRHNFKQTTNFTTAPAGDELQQTAAAAVAIALDGTGQAIFTGDCCLTPVKQCSWGP